MRINGLPPVVTQALLAAATDAVLGKDDAFRPDAGKPPAPPPQPPATGLVPPQTSVEMLVTLASIDPAVERRRRLAADADRGLSALERLRDELATGLASPERLRELADWSQSFTVPDEPALATLAREIDLRVRVELAKHDLTA